MPKKIKRQTRKVSLSELSPRSRRFCIRQQRYLRARVQPRLQPDDQRPEAHRHACRFVLRSLDCPVLLPALSESLREELT